MAAARDQPPDVIVLDIDLPEIDGYSVCRALKGDSATAQIPIIMLTERDVAEDAWAGLQAGAIDYIPKDQFAVQTLSASIRQLGIA